MTKEELFEQITKKKSFLCIGLDTDLSKIPTHLLQLEDPFFEFNKKIIDATHNYCVAYKLNTAFYEAMGLKGWQSLEKTINYLNQHYPNIFTIADAKRGDIGNTSKMYAKAFFENLNFNSITVAPYMGKDSVSPFLEYKNKWLILLALTSNSGSDDFQTLQTKSGLLYEQVINTSQHWGNDGNMMYVVGATKAKMLAHIRSIIPNYFLLVPGVGAQGGSLQEVAKYGMNSQCGLLVNASRSIIYAGNGLDFSQQAAKEAKVMQQEMEALL